MPSPLTSGAATIHMAALTSNLDLGWAYYEPWPTRARTRWRQWRHLQGRGRRRATVRHGRRLPADPREANGAPVEFVFPEPKASPP
jgi:iron(III) transport system substrate-binding protein